MLNNDSGFDLSFDSNPSWATSDFTQLNPSHFNLLNSMQKTYASQLIRGTEGDDMRMGGRERDRLFGLGGDDEFFGRRGDDSLFGNDGSDRLQGGQDNDLLNGGADRDELIGGSGNDSLVGGSGKDDLVGGSGADILKGNAGDDRLWGGQGDDLLRGGTGHDQLNGGNGSDVLVDGDGGDRMTGGRGTDQFQLAVGIANQPLSHITDFEPSKDFIAFNRLDVTPTDLKIQDSNDGATIFWKDQAIAVLSDIAATDVTSDSIQFGNVELAKTLQQTLDQTLPTTISPGVVAAVSTSDDKLWTGASGLSNLENNTPMNAGDRFPIASITKTYTATVVMQLVEEGKLSLEGTLTQYLPVPMTNQIANSSQITIRQLLSHTSGINAAFQTDFTQDLLANPELAFIDRSPEETLAAYVYGRPASFAPGSGLEYNSSNYFLLQEVIEEVTGSTLAKELQQRILGPLDLQNTFLAEKGNNPGGYQPSYQDVNGDGILDNLGAASITFAGGAGALVSTVEDTTRFMQALFEGELLDADTFNEMVNGGVLVPEMNGGLGLGFVYLDTPDQGRQYISSGDVFGWSTQIQYFQETGTTAIAITNADTLPQEQNPNRIILNTIVTSLSSP